MPEDDLNEEDVEAAARAIQYACEDESWGGIGECRRSKWRRAARKALTSHPVSTWREKAAAYDRASQHLIDDAQTAIAISEGVSHLKAEVERLRALKDGALDAMGVVAAEAALLEERLQELREALNEINADYTRLTSCLLAMAKAGPDVSAEALRSVAYDVVMNLIEADVVAHQLVRRSASLPLEQKGGA